MKPSRGPVWAALLSLVLVSCRNDPAGPREILLAARGMTFVLVSDPGEVNPTIRVRPGERVRVTLRNEAPGLMHDFRVPSLAVKTEQIRSGQSTAVSFTAPTQSGRYEYLCGPHSTLMRGFIDVAEK